MKRLSIIVISLLLVSSLILSLSVSCSQQSSAPTSSAPQQSVTPQTQAAKQVLIRVTCPVPNGDILTNWVQEGMDKFNASTNGAYKMQVFGGETLAKLPEMLDNIKDGAIEAGLIPLAAFSGAVQEFQLAELPFLYNNGEANAMALKGINEVYNKVLMDRCNQKSLGSIFVGTLNIMSVSKPINKLEDLKGMNIGGDTPASVGLFKALGANGLIAPFTEDYTNLQKKVIDAKTANTQYILIAKLYEVVKYYTVCHCLGSLYAITINKDVYNKMPQDVKTKLDTQMGALAEDLSQKHVNLFYQQIPDVAKTGVQCIYLTPEERDRWKALVYPSTLDTLGKFGDVGAKIKQLADEANAKYPYTQYK